MTVIVLDSKNDEALTVDTVAPDFRNVMLTAAGAIAATVVDVEGKLAASAKAWGAALFSLAFPAEGTGTALDTLIGDSKVAAGWAILNTNDVGKKAKARLEVYFSNARLVAETFASLSDDDKRDIRAGTVSIHYRAGLIRKAASDATKAAKKEAERVAAETAAAASKAEAEASAPVAAPVERTLADVLAEALAMLATTSDDGLNDAYGHLDNLVAAFDARINAATDATAIAA